jgi:NAD(P)-dependent dehydrogenase (short-subunit alcohol dehydrogenase family)
VSGRFTDRTVVVTGAASGIGRATALRIAAEGGRVISFDIADGGGEATAAEIRVRGGEASAIEVDVAEPLNVEVAVARAADSGGGLDALVNCAGTGFYRHFEDVTAADLHRVMDVNFFGTYWTCQFALESLLRSRGVIVNVASAAAIRGSAYLTAYSASKGAVLAFTKSLAVEFAGRGLRVNCVCPGGVDTPLLRLFQPPDDADHALMGRSHNLFGQMATADDIAGTITFLASSDASHVTGSIFAVDAGSTA